MAFLHEKIILPLSDLLRGEHVYGDLRRLRQAEEWTPEQMAAYQEQQLHRLLGYAAAEVPFYREWFAANGISPDAACLNQLPIVSKALMRREGIARFAAEHYPANERIDARSSGSTGEPFSFYTCRRSDSVNTAAKLRTWYQAGYKLGDRYMKIANGQRQGRVKKWQDRANRCLFVPFYSIDDNALKSILDTIETRKPLVIRSYPAPLYLLARYRNSHPGYTYTPRRLFTTGSTLPEAYRKEIEKAFGCDIIDSYSCEGTPNTYETPAHDGYRVCGYYGIIEVLDNDGNPVKDGIGRVVSTDLWNLAHPFIRYDTQDLVEVRNGQIVRIMGRESDAYIASGGDIYTVHNFSHFFLYDIPGVDSYQIVRHRDDSITFNIVTNKEFSLEITQNIIDFWQPKLKVPVTVNIVDDIPLMHNNKRLTIVEA